MKSPFIAAIAALTVGCTVDPLECAFLDKAEPVLINVVEMTDFDELDPFPAGVGPIVSSDEAWTINTDIWGTDGGISPQFDLETVFVYGWDGRGCSEPNQYAAWREGDKLRVVAVQSEIGECNGTVPQFDLIRVEDATATDVAWCAGR